VLQGVAACYSATQRLRYVGSTCIAVCCSVVHCVAVCCRVLQCVAVRCSVLQCVATCCSTLQCVERAQRHSACGLQWVAVCCSMLQACCSVLQRVAACCSVMQRVAVCSKRQCVYNIHMLHTLQHMYVIYTLPLWTYCNTMQHSYVYNIHTATHMYITYILPWVLQCVAVRSKRQCVYIILMLHIYSTCCNTLQHSAYCVYNIHMLHTYCLMLCTSPNVLMTKVNI